MQINSEVIRELYDDAGLARVVRAKEIVKRNLVAIEKINYQDKDNLELWAMVKGNLDNYHVYLEIKQAEINNVTCECKDYKNNYGACKHIVATMLEIENNERYEKAERTGKKREKYITFKELVNTFYEDELIKLEEGIEEKEKSGLTRQVELLPKMIYDTTIHELKIEFKIGTEKQYYKLKNLIEFYEHMNKKEICKYGTKLTFEHEEKNFEEESRKWLPFIMSQAEIIKYVNTNGNSRYRYYGKVLDTNSIILSDTGIDQIFELLKAKEIEIQKDYCMQKVKFLDKEPDLPFNLEEVRKDEYKLVSPMKNYEDYHIILGKEYCYLWIEDTIYRCTKEFQQTTLKLLEFFKNNYTREIIFGKEELPLFFSMILPKVKKSIQLDGLEEEEIQKYLPEELGVKVYLSLNKKNYIIAKLQFCYQKIEFNPISKEKITIPRDILAETEALNLFRKTGFLIDRNNENFVLAEEEKIYQFLKEDIEEYMKKFEVLATDEFKEREIQKPRITSLGIRMENDLLAIDLKGLTMEKEELKEILHKYQLKKKYHRLKNGTFINLEENEELELLGELLDGTEIKLEDIAQNHIYLPKQRTFYLDTLISKMEQLEIKKEESYLSIINEIEKSKAISKIPEELAPILRDYQKIGYRWLKTLDDYQFGGILADDMGLGKTLQIITLIASHQEEKQKIPVMVVCPSSLSLNWAKEIEKFSPRLKTSVISGNSMQRTQMIEDIPKYDVIITSYDLLKRDITTYEEKNYLFRFLIADEAQYIKNSNTQNAKAIKKIHAQTKYALTGTPIENSLSELWSIFDFLMPGYLFSYTKFKQRFEFPIVKEKDENAMKRLKKEIEPFLLRRTKEQVLKELPDKTITVLNNEMEEEQEKIYLSFLARAKQELKEEMEEKGFANSKMKILTLLTRLRQVCCHPALFIENYKGDSSKLKQCIEIIKEAVASGHKILLFSSYTSMFPMIEKRLQEEMIEYFKLTGATKVSERIKLVDEFNQNPEKKIFLISLKAGGTGLNLTGADVVIHYDPWWNLSAENQATDRAYRIGQKNNVQVYKLITKNSIEEKIYELQEKKADLASNILDMKTSFINQLSKEEIMKLFE